MKINIITIVSLLVALSARAGIEHNPKIWQDSAFQKAFMGSYGVRTDIEPPVSTVEREDMEKIMQLMSDEKEPEKSVAKAKKLLLKNQGAAGSAIFDFTLANMAFQDDNQDEALAYYQSAVNKFPAFQRAWKNMGLIHVRKGNYSDAVTTLTRAIELGATDGYSFGLLGFASFSINDYLSSESAYRQAMLLQPNNLDWKLGLLRTLYKQRRFGEVSALCETLIEQDPEKVDYWLMRANAFLALNQQLKAAQIYELLAMEERASGKVLNMLGDIYVNEKQYSMAADAYLRAATAAEDAAERSTVIRNCEVLLARGAYSETRNVMQALEKGDHSELNDELKKRVLKLEARLAANEGMTDEQHVAILRRIVKLDPLDGEALILLGQYYGRANKTEDAVF